MAITVTQKALDIAADLASDWKLRLSALALAQSSDTDGCPVITLGTNVAGSDGAVIKVLPLVTFLLDALGNAQPVYSPHKIQIVTEADPTGGSGADPVTANTLMQVFGETLRKGTIVEWYQSANGTAPSVSAITAGNLKSTFSNLYNPTTSAI